MSFRDYLKDNAFGNGISVFTYLLMLLFMCSLRIGRDIVLILSIVYFTGFFSRIMWDYFRKKKFYSSVSSGLAQLDRKYLISEIIEEPDFAEGKILYDALYESGKSMSENIAEYRKNTKELQEYIELWVHEIKLPVAGLLLMAHNDENGAKYEKLLQKTDGLIENVLYYARSENSARDYIIRSVNLAAVFRNAAVKNRNELQGMNVSISTEGLDREVTSDEKWLEFIVNQLFSNSMKYFSSSREPEISVYTEETENSTVLHFKDNGIGIPASDLPYIFDKSYTGENGRTRSRSTGMGLYIVKRLCERLGHRISANSVQDGYTDIFIAFGKNDHVRPE